MAREMPWHKLKEKVYTYEVIPQKDLFQVVPHLKVTEIKNVTLNRWY